MDTLTLVPNRNAQQLELAAHARCRVPSPARSRSRSEAPSRGGSDAFRAPAVDVLSLWAGKQLETCLLLLGRRAPAVPSRVRIRRLWTAAIERSVDRDWQAGDIAALAREAMEADRLSEHWLRPQGLVPGESWNDEMFCAWRAEVHREMAREGWLNSAEQLRWLTGLLDDTPNWPTTLPRRLRLVGFLELTRLERRLLDVLARRGIEVVEEAPGPAASETQYRVFRDIHDEMRSAALWARDRLASGCEAVCVAVNGLAGRRPELERVFQQTFHPAHGLALKAPGSSQAHVHGGSALADQALVVTAMDLLEFDLAGPRRPFPFARISRWLRSPAWAGAGEECSARALLELRLRERRRPEWTLAAVAEEARAFQAPVLVERVGRMRLENGQAGAARRFHAALSHWGWPGPFARGAGARRVVEGVKAVFEDLEFCAVQDGREALGLVRQLFREHTLSGPGGPLSPVQVMDLEDVAGHRFDATWVLDVHADNWPTPVRGNRLLPFAMSGRVPRCRPEGQHAHAVRTRTAVLASAPEVVFSRASQSDGVPTAPSPLVPPSSRSLEADPERIPAAPMARAAWPGVGQPDAVQERDALESRHLGPAPGLGQGEQGLKRAVSVLNLQAACPWAAFLVHRVGAEFPPAPSAFADASFTGSLVHRALERLYRPHTGRETLPDPEQVPEAVEHALASGPANALAPGALAAERRRLVALLREWLAHERSLPFARPWRLEAERDALLAGFRFTVRMDRLDRHGDGVLVLDYKTGTIAKPAWDQARPTEVQLPLYAVLAENDDMPVIGAGLLSVRSGDMTQRVWSGDPDLKGPGLTPLPSGRLPFEDWGAALATWRGAITGLLDEYREGVVDFVVHHEGPLRYLGLELLLRPEDERSDEDD